MNKFFPVSGSLLATAAFVLTAATAHADVAKLTIPTLPVPSLGYFTPPIIKSQGFDKKNGLDIKFVQKPASTYRTDFAAGTDLIGGSGTLLADIALLNQKGVKTVYLFNVFDFWGTVVVPQDGDIHTLADLKGKTLAASLPTTNYAMFRYFAKLAGLDMSTVHPRGTTVPGLVPMALAGRTDAVELWEPAYSILIHDSNKFRAIDLVGKWKKATGSSLIPYLGVAAHESWVKKNGKLIPKLYKTYQAAADFIKKHPAEAAKIIGKETRIAPEILAGLIKSDRLGLNVYWAGAHRKAAQKVFEAGMNTGYLKKMPPASVLYEPAH
jgi:ABC-type nitrate/sulfonate/bicarbonate transport system substrate-binding protein